MAVVPAARASLVFLAACLATHRGLATAVEELWLPPETERELTRHMATTDEREDWLAEVSRACSRFTDEVLGLVGTSPAQDSDDFLAQATQGLRLDFATFCRTRVVVIYARHGFARGEWESAFRAFTSDYAADVKDARNETLEAARDALGDLIQVPVDGTEEAKLAGFQEWMDPRERAEPGSEAPRKERKRRSRQKKRRKRAKDYAL